MPHPSYRKYGFTKADMPIIQAFERTWPEVNHAKFYQWYQSTGRNCRTEAELLEKGRSFCSSQGIDEGNTGLMADLVVGSAQMLSEGQELTQQPVPSYTEDTKVIAQARDLLRQDRAAYEKDIGLQRQYYAALGRREPPDPKDVAGPSSAAPAAPKVSASSWAPTSARNDSERKVELQTAMKTNLRQYQESGMDREYSELLHRESAATPTEDK